MDNNIRISSYWRSIGVPSVRSSRCRRAGSPSQTTELMGYDTYHGVKDEHGNHSVYGHNDHVGELPRAVHECLNVLGEDVEHGGSLIFPHLPLLDSLHIAEEIGLNGILHILKVVVNMQVIVVTHADSNHAEDAESHKECVGVPTGERGFPACLDEVQNNSN